MAVGSIKNDPVPAAGGSGTGDLVSTNNLTDVADTAAALANLGGASTTALALVKNRVTVRAATTASITISTALNNGDVLDGVTLATNDLVLVKNQAAPEGNGIIVVGVTPARSSEYDTYNEHPGVIVSVQEGTVNADTVWLCTSNKGGTLDTTAIAFAKISTVIGTDVAAMVGVNSALRVIPIDVTGDETTAVTTGTGKRSFIVPWAGGFTVTAVLASVNVVSSSGTPTIDINEGAGAGTSILSTKLTIDVSEFDSSTAAVPAVISDPSLAGYARITVDVDTAGTDTAGLKVYIIGYVTA